MQLPVLNVTCPNKDKIAKIAAAKLQSDAEWTVMECSPMPDGEIDCAVTCLLKDTDYSK